MTRAQIHRFWKKHYTADGMVVGVAGNVDHDEVVAMVRSSFDRAGFLAPAGPAAPADTEAPAPARRARSRRFRRAVGGEVRVARPFEQANLVLSVNALPRGDERRYALGVLNACLGGGPSSRLFQEVRERRGLAYSVYSYAGHYADAGIFCVGAGCLPGKLEQVLAVVRAELRLLAEHGLTAEELERGKGQLRGGLVLGLEDSAARMSRIAKVELHGEELPSIEEIIRRVDAVTLDEVHASPARCSPAPRRSPSSAPSPAGRARRGADALRREPWVGPVRRTRMSPSPRRPRVTPVRPASLSALVLLAALGGCGSPSAPRPDVLADGGEAPASPIAAKAAKALDCVHPVATSGAGDYVDGGLETVQDDPAAAVEVLVRESHLGGLPATGYDVAAADGDRVLLALEHDGTRVAAFVVQDGVTDWDGNEGWGVRSYAVCDLSELPPAVAAAQGTGVWTDADGERVATSEVSSFPGPEHCDWQDVTFLQVGEGRGGQQYLRDVGGVLADLERASYAAQVPLPDEATDSGWRLEGRALWLVPDRRAAYLVATDGQAGPRVGERWPGTTEPVACA